MNEKYVLDLLEAFVNYMKLNHTHFAIVHPDKPFRIVDSNEVLEKFKHFQSEWFDGEIIIDELMGGE